MKTLRWLDAHFEEALLVILLILISFVELMQVIARNVPFIPALTWAEEFCRFCWIWSVFLSLPYTLRKASMLRVTALMDLFSVRLRKVVNILVDLVNAGVFWLLGVSSIAVVTKIASSAETSPAMKWPMWIVYSIMLPGFFLGTLRALQQAWLHVRHFQEKNLTLAEQVMEEAAEEAEAAIKAEGGIA